MSGILDEPWYRSALAFVQRRHEGKLDKAGKPYYQHFERVSDSVRRMFPHATRSQIEAALLHDALEPNGCSVEEMRKAGIQAESIAIIRRITLPTDGRSYLKYVEDLVASGDVKAIEVKLCDNIEAYNSYKDATDPAGQSLFKERYVPSRRMMEEALKLR